ncbi:MAG: flagellar basal body-associated FliL family protein [Pseudomonadota bacterium]
MADAAEETDAPAPKKKGGILPLALGAVAALALGAGAAYAVRNGIIPTPDKTEPPIEKKTETDPPAFYELPAIAVPLPAENGRPRQLRLALSIETTADQLLDVESQGPRILDSLNTLLRAIDGEDIADPTALDRLRAQMLRRLRLAIHPEAVRDLLIVEYVIL